MAEAVYVLGTLCSLLCAVLLLRQYRIAGHRLLLWSALCFFGLTVTNALVFIDLVTAPELDLHMLRWSITSVSLGLMLFGLVWENER